MCRPRSLNRPLPCIGSALSSTATSTQDVLIVSDPGLPTARITRYLPDIESDIQQALGEDVRVNHIKHIIRVTTDNEVTSEVDLPEEARDVAVTVRVLLTEMPMHHNGHPVVAQIDLARKILIMSCPTMGVLFPKRRLMEVIRRGIDLIVHNHTSEGENVHRWNEWDQQESDHISRLYAHTWTGVPRTISGMVASNQPWKTANKLSSALTAASAAGAFGIFYNSIWEMAESLSPLRLSVITVVSILVMTAWLLVKNRLWDTPVQEKLARVVALYNLSTIATLLLSITALYVLLFVLIFLAGLVVISPGFMESTLGMPTHITNYLNIAWLSASMGVIAGGLGSGFDSETDLQRLTHGQRERQRILTEDRDESDDE